MKFLLDTDHLSILQRQTGQDYINISARMAQHPLSDFAVSSVTFHEQVLGCHAYINRAQNPDDVLTLCGLKTRRFSKTRLKGIVKYPPTRSKQLPVLSGIAIALTFYFFRFPSSSQSQFGTLHVFPLLVYPESQLVRVRGKSGVAPYKTLQYVDDYSYLHFNSIILTVVKTTVVTSSPHL
jgi:hypothetical protein